MLRNLIGTAQCLANLLRENKTCSASRSPEIKITIITKRSDKGTFEKTLVLVIALICQVLYQVLERHVPHFQMITLRTSSLPVFNQPRKWAQHQISVDMGCLYHPTWKLLPQTLL